MAASILLQEDEETAQVSFNKLTDEAKLFGVEALGLESTEFRGFASQRRMAEDDADSEIIRHRLREWRAARDDMAPKPGVASDFWTTQDRLGYQPYADAIAVFIRHADTKPPLTIGIKGRWGAGKTSLMNMIREQLDPEISGGTRCQIELTPESRRRLLPGRNATRNLAKAVRNIDVLHQTTPGCG